VRPVEVTVAPAPEDVEAVRAGMRAYELSVLPGLPDESDDVAVHAFVRSDDGELLGGVLANVFWDGVEIDTLWVADGSRRRGVGAALMLAIEDEARRRGAVVAHLKTVMAKGFYERLGYSVYGVLEDRPIGTQLFHMKKRLDG
jgi:GNAT superfamily N-acetyltransferase